MYDVNTNLSWIPNPDEEWSLHLFTGIDNINSRQRFEGAAEVRNRLEWGTHTGSLKYKKRISPISFLKFHLTYTNSFIQIFSHADEDELQERFTFTRSSNLENYGAKSYIEIYRNEHEINAGFEGSINFITPSKSERSGQIESFVDNQYNFYQAGIFVDDQWTINSKWSLYSGLRWSNHIQDKNITSRLEPRLSVHYSTDKSLEIGFGYQRMAQYSFLAPISNLGLPNDIWISIKDEIINRTSFLLGLPYDWENIIQNNGRGRGYGLETKIDINHKRISGSLAYTLLKTDYSYTNINDGKWYPEQYDIRHQLNLNMSLKLSKKWLFTALFDFKSGRPITVPKEIIIGPDGDELIIYGSKNASRLGLYHRLDIGFQKRYKGKKKGSEKILSFSVFNTYFRYNPFYYSYTRSIEVDQKQINVQPFLDQFGFIPIIPSIAYKVKF